MTATGDSTPDGRNRRGRPAATAGFTLLEVMVAVAMLAVVLTAVFRLHSQTLSMSGAVRFYALAPALLQQKLGELAISDGIDSDSGDFGEDFPGFRWETTVEDVVSESLGQTAERLKKIQIELTYNEGEYRYSVQTYRITSGRN